MECEHLPHAVPVGDTLFGDELRRRGPAYFTPFGARVEGLPVIPVSQPPRLPYWLVALIMVISYAIAILSIGNLGLQGWHQLARLNQQYAWDDRR